MAWISEMGQVVNLLLMVFGFLILSAGLAFAMRSASVYAALSAVLGGVLLGGILYAAKWPGRNNPRFGCHEIFHVFILLGSLAHYWLMYQVIAAL